MPAGGTLAVLIELSLATGLVVTTAIFRRLGRFDRGSAGIELDPLARTGAAYTSGGVLGPLVAEL